MSDSVVAPNGADAGSGGGASPPELSEEDKALARRLGWRDRDEFIARGGRPERWIPPEKFLDNGFENLGVARENVRRLSDDVGRLTTQNDTLSRQLQDAISTVNDLTGMVRTSDKRNYEKAMADLKAQRDKAVEGGDVEGFKRADAEIETLRETAPPPPKQNGAAAPAGGAPAPQPGQNPPEIVEFYRRNPWYISGAVPELTRLADQIHAGLMNTSRHLTLEQNLREVERQLQRYEPDLWARATGQQPASSSAGAPGGQGNGTATGGTGNGAAPADTGGDVTPSSGTGGGSGTRRNNPNARSFANMPQESKAAYQRYKKMLEGKGEPLTEAEWAADYWSQFEEVP